MGVGQGTSLPSWELVSEHNRIEPLPAATGRGSGRRTMATAEIVAIIALITTTAMGLPNTIVAAITLYRTLKSGHGRHRK